MSGARVTVATHLSGRPVDARSCRVRSCGMENPNVPDANPATVAFVYEHTKDAPQAHVRLISDLDDKAVKTVTAGGAILALVGVANVSKWGLLPFGLALASFVVLLTFALLTLKPRDVHDGYFSETLWPTYWDLRPEEARYAVVAKIAEVSVANRVTIEEKAGRIGRAMGALGVEAAFAALAILVSRLTG
jgi:hypothetical protein